MKTFKQFLLEDNLPTDAAEIAALIKRDCASFLSKSKFRSSNQSTWLWRGTNDFVKNAFNMHTVRESRMPTDISRNLHYAIDNALKNLTGYNFRSGQIIFASGDANQAATYARDKYPSIIFPIGDFDFCWSKDVKDAYDFFDNRGEPFGESEIRRALGLNPNRGGDHLDRKEWAELVSKFIEGGYSNYVFNKDLDTAIKSNVEIMIKCKSYYSLTWNQMTTYHYWSDNPEQPSVSDPDHKFHTTFKVLGLL
jgi:hypothetical protein